MELVIRKETKKNYTRVEEITREAFWNMYKQGCDEHYLAHKMRSADCFIKELDMVAVLGGKIVGNIMYTRAKVVNEATGDTFPVISFGPLSVLPEYQKQGIGAKLISETKRLAKEMGYRAIFIYGDPGYYVRTGFVAAEKFKIKASFGLYAAALQACELYDDALKGISGIFYEDSVYEVDEMEALEFDKKFPYKEKKETESQAKFLEMLKMVHE